MAMEELSWKNCKVEKLMQFLKGTGIREYEGLLIIRTKVG